MREQRIRAPSAAPRLDVRNEIPAEIPAELPAEVPAAALARPAEPLFGGWTEGGQLYRDALDRASWFGTPLMNPYERRTDTPRQRRQNRDLQDRLRARRERQLSRWEESLLDINGNALTPDNEEEEIRWLIAHERYQAALAEMDCTWVAEPLDRPRRPVDEEPQFTPQGTPRWRGATRPAREPTQTPAAQPVRDASQTSRGAAQPVRDASQTPRGAAQPIREGSQTSLGAAQPVQGASQSSRGAARPQRAASPPINMVRLDRDGLPYRSQPRPREWEF